MMKKSIYIIGVFVIALITSCTEYETSSITGWDYNNPKNGGFQKVPYAEHLKTIMFQGELPFLRFTWTKQKYQTSIGVNTSIGLEEPTLIFP